MRKLGIKYYHKVFERNETGLNTTQLALESLLLFSGIYCWPQKLVAKTKNVLLFLSSVRQRGSVSVLNGIFNSYNQMAAEDGVK